jgi:hypothetical protein
MTGKANPSERIFINISGTLVGSEIKSALAINSAGILFRISILDSPNIPPIGMPGFDAEKKTNERALSESQKK